MKKKLLALAMSAVMTFGFATVAFAAYDNPNGASPSTFPPKYPAYGGVPFNATLPDGDTEDNGIGNANRSGGDRENLEIQDVSTSVYDNKDIIKSKGMRDTTMAGGATTNQRTHGAYQNNTNSCASCHQTHTGASKDLLIKRGVYNTCTACHDGTLGFYNVFTPSTAGTFGGTEAGNASVHLADGTVTVDMAPGYMAMTGSSNAIAGDNFDCASCHAPHGSYSSRLLHYSPNGMADIDITKKGNKLVNYTVEVAPAALPAVAVLADPAFKVVKGPASVAGITITGDPTIVYVLKKKTIVGTPNTYSYERDLNPWVAGMEHAMDNDYNVLKMAYYTAFKNGAGTVKGFAYDGKMNGELTPIYGKAYAIGTEAANIVTADIARAFVVDLTQTELASFGGVSITAVNTNSYDEPGKGINISNYCGACHTEYMTHSGDKESSGAFRHSTDKDRFNCLKCHFAHGTDVTVMADATDRTVASLVAANTTDLATATAYMLDKNPSSALKRYTNMSVCWKCHSAVEGKSSKLMNNTEYWTNYDSNPKGGNGGVNGYESNWLNNSWE